MTPLARRILKDTLRYKIRKGPEDVEIMRGVLGAHCFELSDVHDVLNDLSHDIQEGNSQAGANLAFLPAERVFIEWESEDNGREGFLLTARKDGASDMIYASECAIDDRLPSGWWASNCEERIRLFDPVRGQIGGIIDLSADEFWDNWKDEDWSPRKWDAARCISALALINSPRIIGRRQHTPHRGLERKLTKRFGVGAFPLRGWTEIKLEICPPEDFSDRDSAEAHLTGQKALHFCRAHLRIRRGNLEVVRGHWRGDAALGIKRSRYRLINSPG